jgi:hypothetical protein
MREGKTTDQEFFGVSYFAVHQNRKREKGAQRSNPFVNGFFAFVLKGEKEFQKQPSRPFSFFFSFYFYVITSRTVWLWTEEPDRTEGQPYSFFFFLLCMPRKYC